MKESPATNNKQRPHTSKQSSSLGVVNDEADDDQDASPKPKIMTTIDIVKTDK